MIPNHQCMCSIRLVWKECMNFSFRPLQSTISFESEEVGVILRSQVIGKAQDCRTRRLFAKDLPFLFRAPAIEGLNPFPALFVWQKSRSCLKKLLTILLFKTQFFHAPRQIINDHSRNLKISFFKIGKEFTRANITPLFVGNLTLKTFLSGDICRNEGMGYRKPEQDCCCKE